MCNVIHGRPVNKPPDALAKLQALELYRDSPNCRSGRGEPGLNAQRPHRKAERPVAMARHILRQDRSQRPRNRKAAAPGQGGEDFATPAKKLSDLPVQAQGRPWQPGAGWSGSIDNAIFRNPPCT